MNFGRDLVTCAAAGPLNVNIDTPKASTLNTAVGEQGEPPGALPARVPGPPPRAARRGPPRPLWPLMAMHCHAAAPSTAHDCPTLEPEAGAGLATIVDKLKVSACTRPSHACQTLCESRHCRDEALTV